MSWVLTGGEDHALVATFPPRVPLPEGWTPIGTVRAVGRKRPGVFVNGESAESVVHTVGAEGAGHVHFG
jgi:thiamine-monophosphate kinase